MHFLQFESERGQTWPLQKAVAVKPRATTAAGQQWGPKQTVCFSRPAKGFHLPLGSRANFRQGAAKIGIQSSPPHKEELRSLSRISKTSNERRRSRDKMPIHNCIADRHYLHFSTGTCKTLCVCGLNDKHSPDLKRRRRSSADETFITVTFSKLF